MVDERESRSVSQEAVAQQMLLEQPTISKIESGQRRVTVEELLVWANALGLSTTSVCTQLDHLRGRYLPNTSIWNSSDL